MTPSERLRALAAQEGFRPDAVEKVQKLVGILVRLDRHEAAEGMWLLKGGTALNLFHLPLPRLSVDIDVNFVGEERVEALRDARSRFENALASCCEREGCTVRPWRDRATRAPRCRAATCTAASRSARCPHGERHGTDGEAPQHCGSRHRRCSCMVRPRAGIPRSLPRRGGDPTRASDRGSGSALADLEAAHASLEAAIHP